MSLHLRIFTTHAIASTSVEQSFTAVKYLKSYFRTTVAEERLNGLAVQDWEAVEGKCICGDYCKIVSVNQVDLFVELTRECEAWQKIIRRLVHSSNRLSQRITKLYCSEMSEELFPVYHHRRASDRTFIRNLCWENRCKTGKPCKESAFVATTAKLYLLIRVAYPTYVSRCLTLRNLCWENRCKTGKPCKESAFVATTAKLYLLIRVAYPTYVSRCLTLRAQCLTFMQIGPFEN
ncbi:hypothetical protein T05_14165 [Trichinella murrelli]|uniref:HAT C-terminal dimerisation domain-containing protein n=1 Tax=Trichinella murrelli TaxID=144512 RepID=A0A0V0T7V8_9BILA|nr:hypothetical protein T05_14165 [Trichinella murrelli]